MGERVSALVIRFSIMSRFGTQELLRALPKIDALLDEPELEPLHAVYPRNRIVDAARQVVDEMRQRALEGELEATDMEASAVADRMETLLADRFAPYYRRVINATGVVLHTNLGRAPLAPVVADEVARAAVGAQRLEMDLETGERGGRDGGCTRLVTELVGCEAATIVNNNAAATLLILAALARGKKVLLSRGEMVEIGGSYRVPDIMEESGCTLVDVGTTNRTHLEDYEKAIDDDTGMILKVHTSNYRVVGFTREVEVEELAALGREHGIPVVHDLGSGCLVDLASRGRPGEHRVQHSIEEGADVVCFSGDKLLGGPQAGIIAGRADLVHRCRKHPLFRAMRPGRLIYTALEATLRLYLRGEETAFSEVPALARLTATVEDLQARAEKLSLRLEELEGLEAEVVECTSQAGSGSLPARDYPSRGVRLTPSTGSVEDLGLFLRQGSPAVVGRTQDDGLILDLRTVATSEEAEIVDLLSQWAAG